MGFLYYNEVDKASQKYYPDWDGAKPNLETFLNALNLSQPIIGSQFELIYSRWPRTTFFAKNISVPGISTNTIEINHAGFTISIPTHVKYDSTELTITIIADKEGYHYYDWRNMVLQSGHPLIAGDPRSMIGKTKSDTNEDYLDVRLRNKVDDRTHHHWIIHNFRPIGIGEVELSHDSSSFVEFEITGTFTHVTYMTGDDQTSNEKAQEALKQEQNESNEENQPSNDDVKVEFPDETTPDDIGQPDTQPEEEQPEPEPPKPKPFDIMNASDSSNEEGLFQSSITDAHFSDGSKVSDQTIADVNECMDEMEDAKKEYDKKMKEIENMSPDPDYNGSDTWSSEDIAITETPTKEQLEKRAEEEAKNFDAMSEDGKLAKNAAESVSDEEPYSKKIDAVKDALKDKYQNDPQGLEDAAKSALEEYEQAKDNARESVPFDKISTSLQEERPCKSQAQADEYQKAKDEYMQKCKDSQNKYKAKKASNKQGGENK